MIFMGIWTNKKNAVYYVVKYDYEPRFYTGKIVQYLEAPGIFTAYYDYDTGVLYLGEYHYGNLEVLAVPFPYNDTILYATPLVTVYDVSQWSVTHIVRFERWIVIIATDSSRLPKYIIVIRAPTYNLVTKLMTRYILSNMYLGSTNITVPLHEYINKIIIHVFHPVVVNKSVPIRLLDYSTFEDGSTDGWVSADTGKTALAVASIGYMSSRCLNATGIYNGYYGGAGVVYKDYFFNKPLPPGIAVVVSGYAMIVKGDANKIYDTYGALANPASIGSVVAYCTDGSTQTIAYLYLGGKPSGWVPIITRLVGYTTCTVYKIRVVLPSPDAGGVQILYDDIAVYIANISSIGFDIDKYWTGYGKFALPPPGVQTCSYMYVNGTRYSIPSNYTLTLSFNEYVDALKITLPPCLGIVRLSINAEGIDSETPIVCDGDYCYARYGTDYLKVDGVNKTLVIAPLNRSAIIESVSYSPPCFVVRYTAYEAPVVFRYYSPHAPSFIVLNDTYLSSVYWTYSPETYSGTVRVENVGNGVLKICLAYGTRLREVTASGRVEFVGSVNLRKLTAPNYTVVHVAVGNDKVTIVAEPYVNTTWYLSPDTNATLLGTWISGAVNDLALYDNACMKFQSYNDTNVMKMLLTFNITTLGWLGADLNRIRIKNIEVYVAGNLSKYVNTKASLEILNWTTGQWATIDPVAFNQTTDMEKEYSLATVLGGNLNDLVSPAGVVAFRINITDVQTYPSTYVYLTLDWLIIRIVYVNKTNVTGVAELVVKLPAKLHVKYLTFNVTCTGTCTGTYKAYADGAEIASGTLPTTGTVNITVSGDYRELVVEVPFSIKTTLTAGSSLALTLPVAVVEGSIPVALVYTCEMPRVSLPGAKPVEVKCYVHAVMPDTVTGSLDIPVLGKTVSVAVDKASNVTVTELRTVGVVTRSGYYEVKETYTDGYVAINVTAPTPYLFALIDGKLLSERVKTWLVAYAPASEVVRTFYGAYINKTLYAWVNLTNPTVKIKTVTYSGGKLGAVIDLTGIGEFNVYTLRLPTEVLVDSVHAMEVPDYMSYRACTPPCYWYDPIEHTLHIKIRGHSPVTIVVDWTRPTQVAPPTPSVKSVRLTFDRTTVHVNEPVHYTVTVELYDTWSGELTYALTCTGPETINITGKITVSEGSGVATGYVTFRRTGTYACTVKILDTYSPTVYVKVISHKAPFMTHTFIAYALLLLLVVAIVVIVIFIVEKKRRSDGGGEIVVRLNI